MDVLIKAKLTIEIDVELDEGDLFDPENMEREVRAFVSQYGPITSITLEHDGIPEDEEDED